MDTTFWVVVPAYNEEKYLAHFLEKLRKVTSQIIVVDDGSQDRTSAIAEKLSCYTLRHRVNLGKGAALRTGCDFAFQVLQAQAVVIMDGDDQHHVKDLSLFQNQLQKGAEIVLGVREEPKDMPWLKQRLSHLSSFVTYLLFGQYVPDIPSGYKAFTATAYSHLRWEANNYAVELEITARMIKARLKFATVCIQTIYHDMNKGFTVLDTFDMVLYILKLRLTL